jgi:hypothetical protein
MPILRWIQGSRYALFNTSPVPDSKEKMMVTLHRLAFPERKEKEGLPLDEIIWRLITRQSVQVKAMTCMQKKKAHLLHSGVGQLVRVHCPKCGWERDDTNPQWAVK